MGVVEPVPGAGTAGADAAGSEGAPPAGTTEGAAGSDGGDDEKKVTITTQEYLVLKAAREEQKRQQADRDSGGTPPTPAGTTDNLPQPGESKPKYIERLRAEAAQVDERGRPLNEAAAAIVEAVDLALGARDDARKMVEMSSVPEAWRPQVKELMEKTGLKSPTLALQFVRGEKYGTVEEQLAAAQAELTRLKANKPPVEGTRIVGAAPIEPKKDEGPEEITADEYTARMADPKRVNATIAARRAGKLVLKRP